MKINDLGELTDKLDEEISWRKIDLSNIKKNIHGISGPSKDTMIRAGVTLLYAHWEGFIKQAATLYLCYVSSLKLTYSELHTNFLALTLKKKINENLIKANKCISHTEIINLLFEYNDKHSKIPCKIDTKSNLNSDTFKDIMISINLEISKYELSFNLIDEVLLANRNKIAHGNFLILKEKDYFELHDKILSMLETFKQQILDATETEAYRKVITT